MRFPVLVNWHCALSQANQPKIQKLEETWCVKITSNRTWPFFSAVTLLHPLSFKNSRSHKNCDFDSETFGLKSVAWRYSQASQSNHLSDAFFVMFSSEVGHYATNNPNHVFFSFVPKFSLSALPYNTNIVFHVNFPPARCLVCAFDRLASGFNL